MIDTLLAARMQMAFSLGFHIIFAALGIAMPLLMLIAEGMWLRTGTRSYLALAKTWGKATGILFAVGAVSGTALSFELGLLWPGFMEFSGSMVGAAFALEGYAFFIEAIFLGLYLYGWNRLSPLAHWLCGIPVAASGAVSGIMVTSVNSWMQNPTGFTLVNGEATNIDPLAALFNPSWGVMAVHSTIACYMAVGFTVAAVYAWRIMHGQNTAYTRQGLIIAMIVAGIAALLQPVAGDFSARQVAHTQPIKLAAMEGQFATEQGAPLRIGGIPDMATGETPYALEIPYALSLLAFHDPNAEVKGLNNYAADLLPNVPVVHIAFQVMVGIGVALLALSAAFWFIYRRTHGRLPRLLLYLLVAAGPLGFVALEAGWIVTEVGRQPWVIYNVMRTSAAVTPAPGIELTLASFIAIYALLSVTLIWLLLRLGQSKHAAQLAQAERPGKETRIATP